MRIREGWSGRGFKKFIFKPNVVAVEDARLMMDFNSGIGFVMGKTNQLAKEWRKVEVIDGKKNIVVKVVNPPANHYFSEVGLSPDFKKAVFIARSLIDQSLGAVSVFDLNTKAMNQIHMEF